ncbi:hypothetical protein ScPMuIL_012474 [Solemya velum]
MSGQEVVKEELETRTEHIMSGQEVVKEELEARTEHIMSGQEVVKEELEAPTEHIMSGQEVVKEELEARQNTSCQDKRWIGSIIEILEEVEHTCISEDVRKISAPDLATCGRRRFFVYLKKERVSYLTTLRLPVISQLTRTDSCRIQNRLLSPSCGENIGEFYTGHPSRKALGRWAAYKVLTLTDTVLAMLACFKETVDGTCDESGLHGAIWSREPDQPIQHLGNLKQLYSDVGFDNNNWETPTDGVCNETLLDGPKYVDSGDNSLECQAMNVPSVPDFSPSGVNGYWYTIAYLGPATTASYRYSGTFEGSVGVTTAGLNSDGECEERFRVIWRPRCSSSPDFGHLSRLVIENEWSYATMKILYSDYDTALVFYICFAVDDGGYCPPEEQRVYILSRTPTLDPTLRDQLNDVVRTACVDPNRLIDADQTSPETDPQQWFTNEMK